MAFATSKDGTEIAYSIEGAGPPVLLVDGALCHRSFGPMKDIAEALGADYQVYYYDRRGRGESGDTEPWSLDREIEDIETMISATGGEAHILGISSGALLAAHAARKLDGIRKLALYEGPMVVDDNYPALPETFMPEMRRAVVENRPGDVLRMFLKRVGTPGFVVWVMSLTPVWKQLRESALTLHHDLDIVEPFQHQQPLKKSDWTGIDIPTLVMDGGKSPAYMRNAQKQWSEVLPNATYRTLPGLDHSVKTEIIVPVLKEFFA